MSPCTLDVVLVTFKDTTDARDNVSYNYHDYDLPYGYSDQGVPGSSSYKLSDFACQSRNSRSSSLDVVQPV